MDKGCKRLIAVSALLISGSASAAQVTLSGTDVDFTFDDATLFGAGNVVGNSLFFQPINFKAESLNGDGIVTTSQVLIVDVKVTTNGYTISDVGMSEKGDYSTLGTDAEVFAAGRLGVVSQTANCGVFPNNGACNGESVFNVGGFGNTNGANAVWAGSTSVALGDTVGWNPDTELQISFENDLTALTKNDFEKATIQKKLGQIGLIINEVPVPAAVWLFGSGLLGLVAVSRRKAS